jgi:hypothetical protein
MADLKVTIKGAAKVDHEVKERRDGSLLVKYISHMSGDVSISLVRPDMPLHSLMRFVQHGQLPSSILAAQV